jgi:transcriptional regulator with XRE-family HTH domain
MRTKDTSLNTFLKDLMRRRKRNSHQLAVYLGINHVTVGRWLSGSMIPKTRSCKKIADYSGVPLENILSIVGHIPQLSEGKLRNSLNLKNIRRKSTRKNSMMTSYQ